MIKRFEDEDKEWSKIDEILYIVEFQI